MIINQFFLNFFLAISDHFIFILSSKLRLLYIHIYVAVFNVFKFTAFLYMGFSKKCQ